LLKTKLGHHLKPQAIHCKKKSALYEKQPDKDPERAGRKHNRTRDRYWRGFERTDALKA
jgi:hypothetical protein